MINHKVSQLAVLPVLVSVCMHATALESMDDASLSKVSGQDGLAINATMDEASIDNITWQDGTAGQVQLNNVSITPTVGNTQVSTDITFETGANVAGEAGINATVGLGTASIEVPNLSLCDSDGTNCGKLGALAVTHSGTETQFSLVTTNGLFNEDGTAQLKAILDNMTVAIKQDNGSQINQLMLGNMYANMTADGKLFVTDTEGLKFIGTVSFDKRDFAGKEREGLELLVNHQAGTASVKNLGKIALTGKLNNVDLSLRGVTGTVTDLGFDNGTNGIAMRMSAKFDPNLNLKVGNEAGLGLTGWKNITDAKSFDSGNVYVNVMPSDASTAQTLAQNSRLTLNSTQIAAAQAAVTTGRMFQKEVGDTSTTTPFGTTGNQYILKDGFVAGANGNKLQVYNGFRYDTENGIINRNNEHVSVKNVIKDGYVAEGPVFALNEAGSGGQFQNVYVVDANGNTTPYVLADITDRRYDDQTSSLYNRLNRQVRVWVQAPDGSTNVVVAPYGGGNNSSGDNRYHKAIHLEDTSVAGNNYRRLGGNNLDNVTNPYTVNQYGEVRDRNGNILLNRHQFNGSGFLTDNSGNYVYEHAANGYVYVINDSTKQLEVRKQSDNSLVKTYQLRTFDINDLQISNQSDYSMTTATASGSDGTQAGQSVSLNIRDMNFQSYATKTEFFDKTNGLTDTQSWSVAPVLYDVNANILLFPKTLDANSVIAGYTQAGESIGYKMTATTKGSNGDDSYAQFGATRTSGLLFTHDDSADASKTRYLGLRHLDSLTRMQGDIQITGDGIAITANDFLFAYRGEWATGIIPEAGETFGSTDRLLITEGRLKGNMVAKIVPSTEGIGFDTKLELANGVYGTNSGLRLIMPEGGSSLNMGELTGTLAMTGTIDTINTASDPSTSLKGALNIKGNLVVNPDNTAAQDLRIGNIGFSTTPISGTQDRFSPYQDQRIGEMALTKHNIYTNTTIRGTN